VAARHASVSDNPDGDAGGSGTGGPGIGKAKSKSGAIGDDVEERLENVLRRLGLEGRALDEMKWVVFFIYMPVLTLVGQEKPESCGLSSGRSAEDRR